MLDGGSSGKGLTTGGKHGRSVSVALRKSVPDSRPAIQTGIWHHLETSAKYVYFAHASTNSTKLAQATLLRRCLLASASDLMRKKKNLLLALGAALSSAAMMSTAATADAMSIVPDPMPPSVLYSNPIETTINPDGSETVAYSQHAVWEIEYKGLSIVLCKFFRLFTHTYG